MIRVLIPTHLKLLADVKSEVSLDVPAPVSIDSILTALEAKYPMLRGTIRDHVTKERRPMLRFFACEVDWTHEDPAKPLPDAIAKGTEPFWIVAAIAGG